MKHFCNVISSLRSYLFQNKKKKYEMINIFNKNY